MVKSSNYMCMWACVCVIMTERESSWEKKYRAQPFIFIPWNNSQAWHTSINQKESSFRKHHLTTVVPLALETTVVPLSIGPWDYCSPIVHWPVRLRSSHCPLAPETTVVPLPIGPWDYGSPIGPWDYCSQELRDIRRSEKRDTIRGIRKRVHSQNGQWVSDRGWSFFWWHK